jgi:hypothetical protein
MPVASTIVLQRLADEQMPITFVDGRDEWWHEVVPAAEASCPVEWMESEAPLFVLYTSGCAVSPPPAPTVFIPHTKTTLAHRRPRAPMRVQVDWQAQGGSAHHGWLHDLRGHDVQIRLRVSPPHASKDVPRATRSDERVGGSRGV